MLVKQEESVDRFVIRCDNSHTKKYFHIVLEVLEVHGTRKRSRPKQRWTDKIKEDVTEKGIRREQTQDRAVWSRLV